MSSDPALEGFEQRLRQVAERNSELGKAIGFVGAKANKLAEDFAGKLAAVRADLRREIEAAVQRAVEASQAAPQPARSGGAQSAADPAFVARAISAGDQVLERVSKLPLRDIPSGRLQFYRQQLDRSREDLGAGLGQAALALAQDSFAGLTTLEVEVTARQLAWETARQSALEKQTALLQTIQQQKSAPAHDRNGQQLQYMLDVDFWTRGQWGQLLDGAKANQAYLNSPPPEALETSFERVETEFVPASEKRLNDLVAAARLSAIRSQQRLNIAERVAQFLTERGYRLQGEARFEKDDYRGACFATLRNASQGELIVAVRAPEYYRSELNTLEIHCFDESPQHVLVTLRNEISAGLDAMGLPAYLFTGFTDPPQAGIREQAAASAA